MGGDSGTRQAHDRRGDRPLLPQTTTTGTNGVGGGAPYAVESPEADDVGAPRRSWRSGVAPRSLSRSASRLWVVGNGGGVDVRRLTLLERGHMTVCRDVVRHKFGEGKWEAEGERCVRGVVCSNAPLSIISENSVCFAERYKLLPRLRIFVYVRMELLAQLNERKEYREGLLAALCSHPIEPTTQKMKERK